MSLLGIVQGQSSRDPGQAGQRTLLFRVELPILIMLSLSRAMTLLFWVSMWFICSSFECLHIMILPPVQLPLSWTFSMRLLLPMVGNTLSLDVRAIRHIRARSI